MNGLKLLLWKNFKILYREKLSLAASIIFPLTCISAFAGIRAVVKTTKYPEKIYESFNVKIPPALVRHYTSSIYYAPSNPLTDKIMQTVLDCSFNAQALNYTFTGFNSLEELNEAYITEVNKPGLNKILAGIIFEKIGLKKVGKNIKYTLKFPGSQRLRRQYRVLEDLQNARPNWYTGTKWPFMVSGGPRCYEEDFGGFPGYYDEGYLYVQHAVNEAILKTTLNSTQLSDLVNLDLHLQRFPTPAFTEDKFSFIMQLFMSLFLAAAFTYNVMELTKQIIHEKSTRLKEFMKIMGLPSWQHWLGWFIRSYVLLVIIVALMVFILKLEIVENLAVLKYSDPLIVFFVLAVYVLNVIAFSFLFSALFSNENSGSTTAAFTWILFQYSSFAYILDYFSMPLWKKILCCFLQPSSPSFLIGNFLNYYENFGEGLQWHNFWHGLTFNDDFSVGICVIMSALNTVIYVLVALYIELAFPGEFGVPLPWYFPFTVWFWMGKGEEREFIVRPRCSRRKKRLDAFEPEPTHLEAGVELKNLTKMFGSKVAVNNLSLKMYQNQVTSLLGPNGAGKTTTMSILTGLIRPTEGTAIVNSYDITTEMRGIRASLGFCPQYNILFDNLTVEEHFIFYCQLKGLSEADTVSETEHGLNILGLRDKRLALAKHLSGGMKRKLCVGMALSAGAKVVLLDEPTAGMDPEARRAIWDLIQTEKNGRTVILSTHYMEEADLLGDRIVIVANGQVLCNGSSLFLKSKFGDAYNLVVVKKEGACSQRIRSLISVIIPSAEFRLDVGAEISCTLPIAEIDLFPHVFDELEARKEELGVGTYGVGSSTMEEIFVRVTSGYLNKSQSTESLDQNLLPTNKSSESVLRFFERNEGIKLLWQQLRALVTKKFLISIRRKSVILLQVVIPITAMLGIYRVFRMFPGEENQTGEINSLKQMHEDFGRSTAFVNCLLHSKVCESFQSILRGYQNIEGVEDGSVLTNLLDVLEISRRRDEGKYLLAFEEEVIIIAGKNRTKLTTLFNNQPFHIPPVALNFMYNGLLKLYGFNNHTITSVNHPFKYTHKEELQSFDYINTCILFAAAVCTSLAFLAGSFSLMPLSETVSKFKYLQIISGVKLSLYWVTDFFINMIPIVIYFLGIVAASVVFNIDSLNSGEVRLVILNCVLCFGWATITSCMLMSTIMKDATMVYSRMLFLNIFGSVVMAAYGLLRSPSLGIRDTVETLDSILSFLPAYGLGMTIFTVGKLSTIKQSCSSFNVTEICIQNSEQQCCHADEGYYSLEENGSGKFIIRMLGVGVLCLFFLVILEYRLISKCKRLLNGYISRRKFFNTDFGSHELLDMDVLAENHRIGNSILTALNLTEALVVKNLTKIYMGKFKAVDGICFGVKKGEVFGLLGVNGAGKTSTFKMLTGDSTITSGDAYINFCSVKTDLRKARSCMGYCPQFDACVDELTGKETLVLFARLKGIPEEKIQDLVLKTSENLMYQHFLDKKFGSLSGGNKRKLSTAIAMLGEPSLILLDEPTAGMDPVARRHVWNAIGKVRDGGTSVLLTSHNMEECEALCSTLAIMVKGQFKCLGSPQNLKSKLCPGYKLVVQLPFDATNGDPDRDDTDDWEAIFQSFQDFIGRRFPGCILKDAHCGFLEYLLPKDSTTWAEIFAVMEEGKRTFALEGYNVGQVDLEQVFFNFASQK